MTEQKKPYLSVVTSLYHSEPYVTEFCRRMADSVKTITPDYEIILVNDGSPDNSLEKAVEAQRQDSCITVIDLSRNFGQHKAMMTGMEHAQGDFIFLIEVDLEEQPEWVVEFHEKLKANQDADVVYGVQGKRKGGFFERLWGALFYKTFNLLAQFKMPENHVTTRLMTRRYKDALLMHRDQVLFLGGVYEQVGFRQIPHLVIKLSHSKTTYTPAKKIALTVNSMVSFSTAPLFAMFWFGLAVFFLSVAIFAWVIWRWLVQAITPGWTSVFVSIWVVGGMLMLSLGVIGLYLKKVIEEVKEQPYTIVRRIYRNSRKTTYSAKKQSKSLVKTP